MNAKEHIDDKLIRYLLGECDAEESREVERWVAESAKNRRYFEDFRRFHLQVQEAVQWEAVRGTYPDFRRRLLQLRGRRKRLRVFAGMAAGLALLVGIGLAVFLKDNGKAPAEAELLAAESIQPGGTRATLHLSNGEQVDLGEEARQALAESDVILAKGMANVETMAGCGYNVYYAFLVKCQRFVDRYHKPLLTPMLVRELG